MACLSAHRVFISGGFDARSSASPCYQTTQSNPTADVANFKVSIASLEFEEEHAIPYEWV
jgi:iron complex outermembrane receptor protein